jgi:hypothetical protein
MANLTSSVVTENNANGPNRIDVVEVHTDHTGKEYRQRYSAPTGWDTIAELALHAARIEEGIITSEAENAAHTVDSIDIDITPVYQTQVEYDRRTLGYLMLLTDNSKFLAGLLFFQAVELRNGANAGQRAGNLGVLLEDYNEIADRFGDAQGSATFINDSKGQIWDELPAEFI